MSLEVTGTLVKVLAEQSGTGKNGTWVKQEFVIETTEQYPKKICISAWGDKAAIVKNFNPGDQLKVAFNLESREYNERWYTDVRAWRIDAVSKSAPSPASDVPPISDADLDTFSSGGDEDELPF